MAGVFFFSFLFDNADSYFSFLDPQGPVAAAQKEHFIWVIILTMIAVLPVFILVPSFLWRYRYKNAKARYTPHWEFSSVLEILMWGVPFCIIAILSYLLWNYTTKLDPYKSIEPQVKALRVQAVALNWKWLFLYPDHGVASVGEMAFPVNKPVAFELTSDTVMQSFMIAPLVGQIYAMPGMTTRLHMLANRVGMYEGMNTQYNGDGFPHQKFAALSLPEKEFNNWVKKAKTSGAPLNEQTYPILANRSISSEVYKTFGTKEMPQGITYFKVETPDLFQKVVQRYHSGQPIHIKEQPGGMEYYVPIENIGKQLASTPSEKE